MCNKNIGGVNLAKVNSWLLYRSHQKQLGTARKEYERPETVFSGFRRGMHVNKPSNRGRPSKIMSIDDEQREPVRKPLFIPTPCADIRPDETGHWLIPVSDKKRCRVCQTYC